MVGRVFLSDVVVHQLEGFGDAAAGAEVGVFVGGAGAEKGFVDAEEVGGAAVDGVDDQVFLAVDPGVETEIVRWLIQGGAVTSTRLVIKQSAGKRLIHIKKQNETVF